MDTQLPPIYYIIFTGVTAAAVLLQACVMLGIFLAVRQTTKKLLDATDEIKKHAIPVIVNARQLLEDITPKVKVVSTNVVEVSQSVRHQVKHVGATVDDLLGKTTAQAARVDGMVTAGLNSAAHAGQTVQHAASVPIRQVSALLAGLRAAFDVLRGKEREPRTVAEDFGE